MLTIDQVELKVEPYNDVIMRSVDEMLKVYSYAPRDYDITVGEKSVREESATLLKQAALLESGQSTEVRVIQSKTANIANTKSQYTADKYLQEVTNSKTVFVTGDTVEYEFKAQAIRNTDGCTIHTSFDAKYGGSNRLISQEYTVSFEKEEELSYDLHLFMYGPFKTLREQTGINEKDGNEIEFVKKIRDNDLIPGINLSSLSDEEIEDNLEHGSRNAPATIVRFLIDHAGLSIYDFLEKYLSIAKSTARFDLSQLSFHFEYDIEIDEETFRSYFMIEGDEEYEAQLAEKSRLDQIKANVDVVKPKVLKKLQELDYGIDRYDLEDLAEQIAEVRDRVEILDEKEDGDEGDEIFFGLVNEFAKSSEYVVHFSEDGNCGYSLTGDRKDGYSYSFETGKYLYTGGYGETFIYVDGDLYDLSGSFPHLAETFSVEDVFDLLSERFHCNVLELPRRLVDQGYNDFNDETLLSATDESDVYAWLEDNADAYDILDILEEEALIEKVVGEYDETLEKFEVDFSDCFEN